MSALTGGERLVRMAEKELARKYGHSWIVWGAFFRRALLAERSLDLLAGQDASMPPERFRELTMEVHAAIHRRPTS